MADYWAKVYIELLDDPKMATMPDRLWRRTIELFLLAKKFNNAGHLPDTKQLAWVLRMTTDELDMDMRQICLTGIIQKEPAGWLVVQFEKRQAASTNTERSQQFRKRTRSEQYGNENETPSQLSVAQRQKTETETETETDRTVVSSLFSSFSLEGELTPILVEHFTEQAVRYGTEKVLGYLGYAEKEGFSWGKARAADVKKGMVKSWEIRE